jgi:hypothetical protein
MDRLHHARVGIAGPVTLQQFDPYIVERIEVGKAVLINRRRQQGILVEQCSLAGWWQAAFQSCSTWNCRQPLIQ